MPVFETASLRDFAAAADRRTFLAELLASFTHVASGRVWWRTARGWRRRRYSDLDPLSLAELVEAMPATRRAEALRRLGDLALFLAGVFPDYAARHPIEPRHLARMTRAIEATAGPLGAPPFAAGAFPDGGIRMLEWLGRASYRLAQEQGGGAGALSDVTTRFVDARRFLNVLTDRYLYPLREQWFPPA